MAEKTIRHASFWYVTTGGINKTALRGDTVDVERAEDLERGERLGAFASKEDLAEGAPLAAYIASREASAPSASVTLDPADVEARTSPAGSADPGIQSGMVEPSGGDSPSGSARSRQAGSRSDGKTKG